MQIRTGAVRVLQCEHNSEPWTWRQQTYQQAGLWAAAGPPPCLLDKSGCPIRQMHSDGKKRRSFLALLFAAGDLRRWGHRNRNRDRYRDRRIMTLGHEKMDVYGLSIGYVAWV